MCLGLPPQLHVCQRQLGELPDQARGGARQDGPTGHPLPCPHQHLQQRQVTKLFVFTLAICFIYGLSFSRKPLVTFRLKLCKDEFVPSLQGL